MVSAAYFGVAGCLGVVPGHFDLDVPVEANRTCDERRQLFHRHRKKKRISRHTRSFQPRHWHAANLVPTTHRKDRVCRDSDSAAG
ncbi:hypothetical protein B0H14DRAFT_3144704 [Mycena olivaceomarginata]|nr:hypothetical protein B0H14DRAFT_3144704 [Mycena olivaceomarginata]